MDHKEFRESLRNMKVLVAGMGRSGRAAVRVLTDLGALVSVQDSVPEERMDSSLIRELDAAGAGPRYFGKTPDPDELAVWDMLVLSPGVPPSLDYIREARRAGAEIIGELELAYRITAAKFAAITGTNGKTTTTALTGEIFRAAGRNAAVVGNIGDPVVTEAENAGADDWMVTEVSSFQLETVSEFCPAVSAILNLTPDHLDRHGTMEAYGNAKAAIAARQSENEYLVVNYDDAAVMALAEKSRAHIVPFSRRHQLEEGAYLDAGDLVMRDSAGALHRICAARDLRIIGDHNIENALAAAAVSFCAGIDPVTIGRAVRDFPGVEHRIEYCGKTDGVDYYNDSKGTNVDASLTAIRALSDRIILIAGGDGKSQDFTALAEHLGGAVKALVLLGRDAPVIEEAARRAGYTDIYNCGSMEECVRTASGLAEEGDRVLLSPACASWDMYPNYEARGRHFKECVRRIGQK